LVKKSWNIRLALLGCVLFLGCVFSFSSRSEKPANGIRDLPSQRSTATEAKVDAEDVSGKLKTFVDEFETKVNTLRDVEARRTLAREYSKKFYDFAKEFPDGEPGSEAWLYVMALADGVMKDEAMNTVLRKAEAELESEAAVKLLGEIISHGEGSPRLKAISKLKQLATANPATVVSVKGLSLLATSQSLSPDVRTDALQQWIDQFIDHDETQRLLALLAENQSAISELWLKKFANQSQGEIKALAIVRLAKYINRRNSVIEFYHDAPASRFEGMPREFLNYLNTEIEPDEREQLVRLLKSVDSNNDDLITRAKRELNAIENLAIGKLAPEIEGTDFDGTKFKLSDYRGRVVLLDFWGDW